jgi:predicted nucleotidyltransferase
MNRNEVIAKLKAAEPQLRAHGVAALYLFGSYARDEARQDSDVDVFVDPARRSGSRHRLRHPRRLVQIHPARSRRGRGSDLLIAATLVHPHDLPSEKDSGWTSSYFRLYNRK